MKESLPEQVIFVQRREVDRHYVDIWMFWTETVPRTLRGRVSGESARADAAAEQEKKAEAAGYKHHAGLEPIVRMQAFL